MGEEGELFCGATGDHAGEAEAEDGGGAIGGDDDIVGSERVVVYAVLVRGFESGGNSGDDVDDVGGPELFGLLELGE